LHLLLSATSLFPFATVALDNFFLNVRCILEVKKPMPRSMKVLAMFSVVLSLAACGGGSEPEVVTATQLRPTLYLEDGRVVSACSAEPRCAGQWLVVPGSYKSYTITRNTQGAVITSASGTTIQALPHSTRLYFSDAVVALDIDGNAGQVYRLYQAAFNRKPDLPGLGYWINFLDAGVLPSVFEVADNFYRSDEFRSIYGNAPSHIDLITRYYRNALQREPDRAGLDYWVDLLNRHVLTPAQVLVYFSESPENKARVNDDIQNGILYVRYVPPPGPQSPPSFPFTAGVTMAPANGATVSGSVRLEVRGNGIVNAELLPAQGFSPKLGIFNVSPDGTFAWLDFDTTRLPDGAVDMRISVFNVAAGQPNATEVVAMPVRRWEIRNGGSAPPRTFSATVIGAPVNGAVVTGEVRLEVRGSGIGNVELLPANGYTPRLGVFNVSADKTYAWLDYDSGSLPDGPLDVRISAFNVAAGQPNATEIIAMPARRWELRNGRGAPPPSTPFSATVVTAPPHGAVLGGVTRLEVQGSGIENVELLPASGYTPRLAVFNISADKTRAWLDFDTRSWPNGPLEVRISAFSVPAGQPNATEIVAMPVRRWELRH
jgi:hypothetical protein